MRGYETVGYERQMPSTHSERARNLGAIVQSGPGGHRLPATVTALATALFVLLSGDVGLAHVAPSVDTNNRYLKISAMPDRIRMVYTVYIGEIPGAQARRRMDTDRDGVLSDAEAQTYGDDTAQQVAQALAIELDGTPAPITWAEIDVGLGTPAVDAGSFSVDLVTWLCLDGATLQRSHSMSLFDHFKLTRPGETELRVEASPGLRIGKSTLGVDGAHSQLEFKWRGAGGPTSKLGFFLDYSVDPDLDIDGAACPPDGEMTAATGGSAPTESKPKSRNAMTAIAIATAVIVASVLVVFVVVRRRRQSQGSP
jgi:hypothetical protein